MAASDEALAPSSDDLAKVKATLGNVVDHLATETTGSQARALLTQVKALLDERPTDAAQVEYALKEIAAARKRTKFTKKHLQKVWRIVEHGLRDIESDIGIALDRHTTDAALERASKRCERTMRKVREWMFWAFEEGRIVKGHLAGAEVALTVVKAHTKPTP